MASPRSGSASAGKYAFVTCLSFLIYRFTIALHLSFYAQWVFLGLVYLGICKTAFQLFADWKRGRLIKAMETPLGLEGSTHVPTVHDLIDAGLTTDNSDGQGYPIGAIDGKMLFYKGVSHLSIRAPNAGGKSESSAALACFALGNDRNLVVTGKGPELALLAAPYRMALGQDVIIIDPFNQTRGSGLSTHDFNFIGHLVRYAEADDRKLLDKSPKMANLILPEPQNGSGDNKIFRGLARLLLNGSFSFAACLEAETGELICNVPAIRSKLCSSDEELQGFLMEMSHCERYDGSIAAIAKRFLSLLQRAPKTAEGVLIELDETLALYDKGSTLGQRTQFSDFDPADIKRIPMSVFIVMPPELAQTHGIFAGAAIEVFLDLAIEADQFEPRISFILDEFANLSPGPIPSITTALFIGRSRGVQVATYVQETESYTARYGPEASAFTTQSEVVLAWGIRSTKDAEDYTKRAGQRAVMTENINLQGGVLMSADDTYSLGISEKAITAFPAGEFLQMEDYKAVLFFKQNPPQTVDLISYRMIEPYRSQAGTIPGAQPLPDLPIKFRF